MDAQARVAPYLSVKGAAEAVQFYQEAFGAVPGLVLTNPKGQVDHAEIRIGDALLMLADEFEGVNVSPATIGGSPVLIHLEVEDVDAALARAVAAGAKVLRPVADQFYGSRDCKVEDPFGHLWMISTKTEQISDEEIQRRYEELCSGT